MQALSWPPKIGQRIKIGAPLTKDGLDERQTQAFLGRFFGEGGAGDAEARADPVATDGIALRPPEQSNC